MTNSFSKAGFSVSYREDGIIHYHFENLVRATVDAWVETAHQHDLEALASGKHLLRLNTSSHNAIPSPYTLSRAVHLNQISPSILESQAFVVTNQLTYHLIAAFINRLSDRKLKSAIRIFKEENLGIEWLLQRGKEQPSE